MKEYIEGMKVKPVDRRGVINLELYTLNPSWASGEKITLVASVVIPYELFKKFFIIKRSSYRGLKDKKEKVKEPKTENNAYTI